MINPPVDSKNLPKLRYEGKVGQGRTQMHLVLKMVLVRGTQESILPCKASSAVAA